MSAHVSVVLETPEEFEFEGKQHPLFEVLDIAHEILQNGAVEKKIKKMNMNMNMKKKKRR